MFRKPRSLCFHLDNEKKIIDNIFGIPAKHGCNHRNVTENISVNRAIYIYLKNR